MSAYDDMVKQENKRWDIILKYLAGKSVPKEFRGSNRDIRKAEIKEFWQRNKEAVLVSMIGFGILAFLMVSVQKANKVNKQVQEYEKTIPGYIEQKQMVEHYRDSLMSVKGR